MRCNICEEGGVHSANCPKDPGNIIKRLDKLVEKADDAIYSMKREADQAFSVIGIRGRFTGDPVCPVCGGTRIGSQWAEPVRGGVCYRCGTIFTGWQQDHIRDFRAEADKYKRALQNIQKIARSFEEGRK